jgi:hypothetical protein
MIKLWIEFINKFLVFLLIDWWFILSVPTQFFFRLQSLFSGKELEKHLNSLPVWVWLTSSSWIPHLLVELNKIESPSVIKIILEKIAATYLHKYDNEKKNNIENDWFLLIWFSFVIVLIDTSIHTHTRTHTWLFSLLHVLY